MSFASDVVNCAKAVRDIAREHNASPGDWVVEVITHDQNVCADIGNTPQAVIDEEVGDEFDLFIMFLWTRIGTKLPSGRTGMEHEFDRAKARREVHGEKPVVAVLFSDAPIAPSKINSAQLQGVFDFKTEVQQTALYKTFTNKKELKAHVMLCFEKAVEVSSRKAKTKAAHNFDDLNSPLPNLAARVRQKYPKDS